MNVDQKILEGYQWIVDVTGKKITWLAFQSIMLNMVIEIIRKVLYWEGATDAVFLFISLTFCGFLAFASQSEATLRQFGASRFVRPLFLAIITLDIFYGCRRIL